MSGSSRPTASPEPSPPLWARALLAFDRTAARGAALRQEVRDELLWAWTKPRDRDALTLSTYARDARYVEGAPFFERGFFAWETQVLARLALPRGSRVLVGGAGGGREMRALAREGYVVTAFEPCARLADAADVLARGLAGTRVLRGGYADLLAATRGGGPLAPLAGSGPYALVLLGWRSVSHVIDPEARAAIFAALGELAPHAVVVASFLPRLPAPNAGSGRRTLRRALAALGAPGTRPPGGEFFPNAGFAVALSKGDLERDASPTHTLVHHDDATGEGVAIFEPRTKRA